MYNLLFIFFFCLAIFIDHIISKNFLGLKFKNYYLSFINSFYLYIKVILFIIFLFIYSKFNLIPMDILPDFNIFDSRYISLNMADKDTNVNIGNEATVNINNPNLNASISKEGINNLAAAISSAGGATVGFKVAQYVGGPPIVKVIASLGAMAVVHSTTSIMYRVLNNNSTSLIKGVKKFLSFSAISDNNGVNNLNDYPLNLLHDVDILLYGALIFFL